MEIFKRLLLTCVILPVVFTVGLSWTLVTSRPIYAGALQSRPGATVITDTTNSVLLPMALSPPNLSAPVNGAAITNPRPMFDWSDVTGAVSYTLHISGENAFSGLSSQATTVEITTTNSIYTPTQAFPGSVYTWTVQAHDTSGSGSGYATPFTFTLQASQQIFLPIIFVSPEPVCPTTSAVSFELIPIEGSVATDHPPPLHGDLNLSLRGYNQTNAPKTLQDYNGGADSNAPQLAGLFNPNQFPGINTVYRVNSWNWGCGSHGCAGDPIIQWPVTMMGLSSTPGQKVHIPERGPQIYSGGYKAMVLYAEERRITFVYTRKDTVVGGYTVHLENICVDPNLVGLYQAQTDAQGWHTSGYLPALRNDQALGTALGGEVPVVIRDGSGSFLDPRSRKDWWQGY